MSTIAICFNNTDNVNVFQSIQSITQLLQHIKDAQLFEVYKTLDHDEEHERKYPYKIPLHIWKQHTDWKADDFCCEYHDGALFVDRPFDSDFRDYDSPERFVYISTVA